VAAIPLYPESAAMPTSKRKVFDRNFWKSLIAAVVGNTIYFSVERFLPPRGHHQLYQIDWGLAIDFYICLVCYVLLRMIP
jgi:hypothetical protein